MNIYIPFTYIIGWSKHKRFYYGAKYAQGCQPKDLWESYFTSSEYVKSFREEHGEPDIIKIHRIFSDKDSCVSFENEYLTKIDAKNHILFLNNHNSSKGFDAGGKVSVKDKEGNTYQVSTKDSRYISGELTSIHKDMIIVKDKEGNTKSINRNDKKYIAGQFVGISKGKVSVKDIEGNTYQVSIDDPRFLSGELTHVIKGRVTVKDKEGNTMSVSVDDPRYLSGELYHIMKGTVNVMDQNENIINVSVDDPRYLSGELKSIMSGKVSVKDKLGNIFYISNKDPRYLSGELIHAVKGFKYEIKVCPYCNKTGAGPNMKRYHFDNCKLKPAIF